MRKRVFMMVILVLLVGIMSGAVVFADTGNQTTTGEKVYFLHKRIQTSHLDLEEIAYYLGVQEVPDPGNPEYGTMATNYLDRSTKQGDIPTIDLPPELQGQGIKYAVVDPAKSSDDPNEVSKLKFLQENGKYIVLECRLYNPE
ncbi:hypothetical protein [Carboxydothermus hydrogenoformans]|uniref:Lipoprotein n=1 Tax=Carboxydothermus hydrogenoformans (strain ATCC BAA-161 / DSM 6008 / Z-2901) TaxID=246194 RepID=Q3AA46_CARHZ|nr:hypothetical protein [Carboxydothermus hydrogenoformans]ABB15596.1 hypothetical protein CHY_2174 [Carboxydothermus hydrogenoformans Z-2901]